MLRNIKLYIKEFHLTLLSYCLMPNHYHFLIRQGRDHPAGMLPQRVFNSYSKAYNKRYEHTGTLFEGPYRVIRVEKDAHLLHLCRYIHANPVKDGFVLGPGDWLYSNYLEWVGQRNGTLFDPEFVKLHFGNPAQYCEFVMDYLSTRKLPPEVAEHLKELES